MNLSMGDSQINLSSEEMALTKEGVFRNAQLASRPRRLLSRFIDLFLFLPAHYFGNGSGTSTLNVLGWVYAFILGISNLILLHEEGQTIGKMIMKTRIVLAKNGLNGGIWNNLILRSAWDLIALALGFFFLLPSGRSIAIANCLLAYTLDYFFIFRKDRRCLHDLIAKTVVVKA
jgi:uncharacterized RDD family membrane protein YckC